MVRLDLAFLLCCCRACLGSQDRQDEETYYDLLGIEFDATGDEIKRAYKRQSLQMHPDKLAQKGKTVTVEDQLRFTRMKEAYEVLSDPHKRETYDAIGARGMKWIDEPFSIDPQEMARNFATSSTLDRSKIFSIFVFLAIAIFIQPILICMKVDGKFGNAQWMLVFFPIWIWSALIAFYHARVIGMGKVPKPDHIPEEEWEDPLPMRKRITGFIRYLLFLVFELQAALRLDQSILYSWLYVFAPLFIIEGYNIWKKNPLSRRTVLTIVELEAVFGKPLTEFNSDEKETVERHYIPVTNRDSPESDAATKEINVAKQEVMKIFFRILFIILLILQLDGYLSWSYWLIFAPFFLTSFCICFGDFRYHSGVKASAEAKLNPHPPTTAGTDYGAMEEGNANTGENAEQPEESSQPLSEEEKEEIRARLMHSSSRMMGSCCSQLLILILMCVGLAKIQGAGYSSVWIIFPFLLIASIILCLLGCMIFCVSPIDEEDMMFDPENQNPASAYFNMDNTYGYTPAAQQSSSSSASPATVPASSAKPLPDESTMRISELKSELESYGLSTVSYFEKKDLVDAVKDARAERKTPPPEPLVTSAPLSQPPIDGKAADVVKEIEKHEVVVAPPASQLPAYLLDGPSTNEGASTNDKDALIPTPSEVDDLD